MGKQPGLTSGNAAEPVLSSTTSPLEPFVFPHGPSHEKAIEVSEDRVQGRLVEAPVVLNPASKNRIPHARQVVDGFVTPQIDPPVPHLLPHPLCLVIAHRWCEADEVLAPLVFRPARAKRVPEEVELLVRVPPPTIIILAVDDLRLYRMKFQSAPREAATDAIQNVLRLLLSLAVRHNIIRVPFERHGRMSCAHPVVERKVQEDIRQQGTDDSSYAVGNFEFDVHLPYKRGERPHFQPRHKG